MVAETAIINKMIHKRPETMNGVANIFSIFMVSAGTLAFEVVLTRVFALAYWHHFAGLLISLALTGFGTAGSLLAFLLPRLGFVRTPWLLGTALAGGLAMPLAYLAALGVGLEPLALAWSKGAWLDLGLVCLVLVVPFLLAAAHIGLVLAWSESPGRDYAANLAGSAAGVSGRRDTPGPLPAQSGHLSRRFDDLSGIGGLRKTIRNEGGTGLDCLDGGLFRGRCYPPASSLFRTV